MTYHSAVERPILIIDDEKDIGESIADILQDEGFKVITTQSPSQAIKAMTKVSPQLILLDVWLKGVSGFTLLNRFQRHHPDIPVLMISGHGTLPMAVEALQKGAYDFIEKPFQANRLLTSIRHANEKKQLVASNQHLQKLMGPRKFVPFQGLFGKKLSSCMEKLLEIPGPLLLSGPKGTGKESVARHIHACSPLTQKGAFVKISAAHIDPYNAKKQFFGQTDESFGLIEVGFLDQAYQGTLFIEGIDYLDQTTQKILSSLMQTGQFERSPHLVLPTRTRLIGSSSYTLEQLKNLPHMRHDFLDRLAVNALVFPPLKERSEDLHFFADYFANSLSQSTKYHSSSKLLHMLDNHTWPHNLDELKNFIERCVLFAPYTRSEHQTLDTPPPLMHHNREQESPTDAIALFTDLSLKEARLIFEKQYLQAQLARCGGSINKTACMVGMERSALHRKMKHINALSTATHKNVAKAS